MAKVLAYSFSIAAMVVTSVTLKTAAVAQEPPMSTSADVPTAINEIFYDESGPYFRNRNRRNYINFMFGLRGFSERHISQDAETVSEAAFFLLEEQTILDPTIRVVDLPTPFNTSILELPASQSLNRTSGSEFIFEPSRLR